MYALLAIVCLMFVVGIGDAVAQVQYPIEMNLEWIYVSTAYDVEATAQLLDVNEDPIGDAVVMVHDLYYEQWTCVLLADEEDEPFFVRFEWDDGRIWSTGPGVNVVVALPTTFLNPEEE